MNIPGTRENPLRILVADNWGDEASYTIKNKFPNVTFSVHTKVSSTHPHGHMVAEAVCHMLPPTVHAEVVFYPFIQLQQTKGSDCWVEPIEEAREAGKPFHVCNCSFGAHHGNSAAVEARLKAEWMDGTKLIDMSRRIGETTVVFAAGNQDRSRRGRPHMANDVNYPQRPLSALNNVFVIGSCDINAIPSLFSSDGEEVFSMYWGEGVPLFDPFAGRVVKVNGTSFAAPLAAGDIGRLKCFGYLFKRDMYLRYVLMDGEVAEGWVRGDRHRKAGYGCMMSVIRRHARKLFPETMVELTTLQEMPVTYEEFEKVSEYNSGDSGARGLRRLIKRISQ